MWNFLGLIPGHQTFALFSKYLAIAHYTTHDQRTNFTSLKQQYPPNTKFIVLPMDMEFMKAGRPKQGYREQMQQLALIKKKA
jgi:hypothetical protein